MNDRHPSGDPYPPAPAHDAAYEPYSSYDSQSVQYADGSGGCPGTGYDGYDAYASGQVASAAAFVPDQPGPADPYAVGYPADTFSTGSYTPGAFAGGADFSSDPLFGDLPGTPTGVSTQTTAGYPADPYGTTGYVPQDAYAGYTADGYGPAGHAYGTDTRSGQGYGADGSGSLSGFGSYDTGATAAAGWAGQPYAQDQQWGAESWGTDPYGISVTDPAAYGTTGHGTGLDAASQVTQQRQSLDTHGFEVQGTDPQHLGTGYADYAAVPGAVPGTDTFAQPPFGEIEPELADYERELAGIDPQAAAYAPYAPGPAADGTYADHTDHTTAYAEAGYGAHDEYGEHAEHGAYAAHGEYADDARAEYADQADYAEYGDEAEHADQPEYEGDASYDDAEYAEYPEHSDSAGPAGPAGETDPAELAPVTPRGARPRGTGRTRRRTPARRSALLTVAVPSVCVIGVAGAAAASVVGGGDDGKSSASAVKPAAANNKLDAQLDGLSADTRDFADRASRTQERIDLKAQQKAKAEAARKKAAAEAARKERMRPKFALPVARHGLSAFFGQSSEHWMTVHTGIDFPVSYGTQVMAATDGTVRMQYDVSYGNMAIVTAKDGTETWYCHLSSYRVSSGTAVKAGDVIAFSGSSGNSTGPHLHFEVRPGGGSPINPLPWLRSHGLNPQ